MLKRLPKFQNVTYLGYVPHTELIKIIANYHIGLLGFPGDKKAVGYFKYASPNRVYLYLHAGLIPVIDEEMIYLRKLLNDFAIVINKEEQLTEKIHHYINDNNFIINSPQKTQSFARTELVFDNYLELISKIYQNYVDNTSKNK